MRARGLLWPSFITVLMLATLCGLGVWQLQRRDWKLGLLQQIAERTRAEPVPLADALKRWRETGEAEYLRVTLTGRFRHDQERHLFTTFEGAPGWDVFTPLETADGLLVLVDRGFVPAALEDADRRAEGQVGGIVTLTGLVRHPQSAKGLFEAESDPARSRWYWPDLAGMAGSLGIGPGQALAPFFVYAERSPVPGGWPKGGTARLDLPNRHLEYALTWFGLALTLLAVYAVYAVRVLRSVRSDAPQP